VVRVAPKKWMRMPRKMLKANESREGKMGERAQPENVIVDVRMGL